MNIDELIKFLSTQGETYNWVDGNFKDLDNFNFYGVYVIYDGDNNNEVVYIGSAYAREVKDRLEQYIHKKDTGNTLMHAICIKDMGVESVKEIKDENSRKAIKQINNYKIKAIKHEDLEYKLIQKAVPKYNTAGRKKMKSTEDVQKKEFDSVIVLIGSSFLNFGHLIKI